MTMEKDHPLRHRIPQDQDDADEADKALAREMEKLSMKEHERILFDIHGVREKSTLDSDESTAAALLEEFQRELSLLVANKKAEACERAWNLNSNYVENRSFRKLFLRAEEFNPKLAAQRFALFFEIKKELFVRPHNNNDESILVREVTWDDLDELDQSTVLSGLFQIGSQRDVGGRPILFSTTHVAPPGVITDDHCRALWYMLMSALRTDDDMQSKGLVGVTVNHSRGSLPPAKLIRNILRVRKSLPIAVAAAHYCYANPALSIAVVAIRLLAFAASLHQFFRIRFHHGTLDQIAFELRTFGIPVECSPWYSELGENNNNTSNPDPHGKEKALSLEWHLEWVHAIRKSEFKEKVSPADANASAPENNVTCIVPRRFDVLFGRSPKNRVHPGNLRCYHLVRMHLDVYENSSRTEKTEIAYEIVAMIEAEEGRFLRFEKDTTTPSQGKGGAVAAGSWVVVDHTEARAKVAHMFRRVRAGELGKVPVIQTTEGVGVDDCDFSRENSLSPAFTPSAETSGFSNKKTARQTDFPEPQPKHKKLFS